MTNHGAALLTHGLTPRRSSRTSFGNQTWVLFKRCLTSYSRNPANATGRILMATLIGIVAGLVFLNIGSGALSTKAPALA